MPCSSVGCRTVKSVDVANEEVKATGKEDTARYIRNLLVLRALCQRVLLTEFFQQYNRDLPGRGHATGSRTELGPAVCTNQS